MGVSLPTLKMREHPLCDSARQAALLKNLPLPAGFEEKMAACGLHPLQPVTVDLLQVNVGKMCNQTCGHCHVDAGPDRTEIMTRETMAQCLTAVEQASIGTVDITGGAPEMNPHFFWFVEQLRALGVHVIDRCNLTILMTQPHRATARFLAEHEVEVVCSLPHYRKAQTDRQRGDGVFEASINALRQLNALGYGDGRGLLLTLVTNPVGAFLPGNQVSLEREWKTQLDRNFGIRFDRLYTITNMPISRFLDWLVRTGNLSDYMQRLLDAFNPAAAAGVMCRTLVSVGWDGVLYDCDFNQMLEIPVDHRSVRHVRDFDLAALNARRIQTGQHCFGCAAGTGSSCSGAVG